MPRVSVQFSNCVQRDQTISHLSVGHFDRHVYRKYRDTTIVASQSEARSANFMYGPLEDFGESEPECPPGLYPGQDVHMRVFPFDKTVETLKEAWNMWLYGANVDIQARDSLIRINADKKWRDDYLRSMRISPETTDR